MELRVLEICRSKGITQKKLAEMIDMSPVGISKAINGNPTKDTLEKIAGALGVPVTELMKQNLHVNPDYKDIIKEKDEYIERIIKESYSRDKGKDDEIRDLLLDVRKERELNLKLIEQNMELVKMLKK